MAEAALNAMAQQLVDLTLCKTRYDAWDLQWYTEGPFWRRTNMRYSREYKIIPDYEIGDMKHGKTLENILDESSSLFKSLEQYRENAGPKEIQRTDYLLDHVQNLNIRTRMLLGEKFSFDQMTDGLYCLVAPAFDYKQFDDMMEELNQALPGKGSVQEKIAGFRQMLAIPPDRLLAVIKDSTQVFHDIAVKRMNVTGNSMPRVRVRELPSKDMVFLSILFGYDYNHIEYERNFNLLYPWTVDRVVEYVGHEMEPGHLTYFEKRLQTMIDTCWPEMSIVSQFSTSNAFGEGSARHVISMSFDNSVEKQKEFEREIIFKNAGIDPQLAELMPLWHRYCELSGYGKLEASRKVWDRVWTDEEAGRFLERYAFVEQGTGTEAVGHLAEDDGHFVAHDYSRDVVREYFNAVTEDVQEQWKLYEKLCCSHVSMRGIKDKTFRVE
ncbi:MAG: hypothetical protein LUH04_13640 [Clostridium sp.]|nr:hypothetical protein [Clostridium sp.]